MRANDRALVANYAATLDALPVIAFMTNPDADVIFLNAQWYRFTDTQSLRRGDDVVDGSTVDLRIDPLHAHRVIALWRASCAAGVAYRGELRVRAGDGTYRSVVAEANPLRDGVRIVAWVGTLTDIHELRTAVRSLASSEERVRVMCHALPGSTWIARPDGRIVEVGDGSLAIAGRAHDRLGDGWMANVHADDRPQAIARWAASLANGEPYEVEFRVRMADGGYRWFFSRARAQRDEDGAISRWVGVAIDIDDRKRIEREFNRIVAEAGRSLRTPLTVVSGYVDLLASGAFEDARSRTTIVAALVAETKRIRAFVERLMKSARLERPPAVQIEIVDVVAIVRQAIHAFAVIARTPISFDATGKALVSGDPGDVYEILAALIENAIAYGAGGPIVVSVSVAHAAVLVRVTDAGPGIAERDRADIVERMRGVTPLAASTSGLGLTLAARAAARLGGRLRLEDARAGSTTVALTLPEATGASVAPTSSAR